MGKAIAIGYLTKVSAGNVNAAHTEGNVIWLPRSFRWESPHFPGPRLRRRWALSLPRRSGSGYPLL